MFWTRFISSVVLVVIALVTLILGGPVLAVVSYIVSLIGYFELCRATKVQQEKRKINGLELVGMLGITGYYAAMFFSDNVLLLLMAIIGTLLGGMCIYVVNFPKYHAQQVMENYFNFMYAPVMLSFIYMTRQLHYGEYIVWLILISSWGSDTCAYLVGICIGKKKIFPVLSPKKSLEGCIGGVIGAGLLGAAFGFFIVERVVVDQTITWIVAFICMVGAVMSQVGDLAASAIKRNHEIKDYGKLIPGHGGIMDRFDSVIVTAPMIYFLTALLIR
ncbi:MAG TPA: phosphatidate cytidylyltransferase [Lachnospiraceae bacterium]|nr:phosphatidate cytidylyltransferase [Lachnospiraceae bacterium]